jgi:hypothetical protein
MSRGVCPSCNCRSRWPKEAFTGEGRAEISSLLLPTQIMNLAGEVVTSVAVLSWGAVFFKATPQYGKFTIFRQALFAADGPPAV